MLGGGINLNNSHDLNNIMTVGDYVWGGGSYPAHAPKVTSTSHMTVRKHANGVTFQVVYTGVPTEIYSRSYDATNTSWSSWVRVDNFGCNTAADLASLLKPYL